jgi:hypothetical protein
MVRTLLRQARTHLDDPNPLSHVPALLCLHDAAELVLGIIADERSVRLEKRDFEKSIDSLEAAVGGPLPKASRIRALNKARVALKHHGVPSDRDAVLSLADDTETFATESLERFTNLRLENASLATMIRNPKVRREACRAEKHLDASEFAECGSACAVGFAYLTERLAEDPRWTARLDAGAIRGHSYNEDADVGELKRQMVTAIETLQKHSRLFGLLASGIGLTDYWHFAAITPHVSLHRGRVSFGGDRLPLTATQARFCLDYLITSALGVQETRGGVFSREAVSVRATRETPLLACAPDGIEPDPVSTANPGELFAMEWYVRELVAGDIVPVVQLSTGALLWIDAGALERVTPVAAAPQAGTQPLA